MAFKGLREFMEVLEQKGELKRINVPVDWDEEMGAIAEEALLKDQPALLFENIKDHRDTYGKRVLMNTYNSLKRLLMALDLPEDIHIMDLIKTYRERIKDPLKPILVSTGPCKEVIRKGEDVNLFEFPTPKSHHEDGGRYIQTIGGVITRDPESGWQNIGIYRGMILDRNSIGMLWIPTQHWGMHGLKYQAQGKPMPMAIAIGGGPLCPLAYYSFFPKGVCEYDMIGAIQRAPLELVKCETVDLEVPASSEIVLEGEMDLDPKTYRPEGPFGEYPGYYTTLWSEPRPVFKVNCITHREDPILETYIMGMARKHPLADPIIFGGNALIWDQLEMCGIPGITGVYGPPSAGAGWTIIFVSIDKKYYGHARQIANVIWGLSLGAMIGKYVVVVDSDIDITKPDQVLDAIANRTQGEKDILICPGTHGGPLDPGISPEVKRLTGGIGNWDRVLIDATWPFEWEPREEWGGLRHPPVCQASRRMIEQVRERWKEYGLE